MFTLTIETGNDAFTDDYRAELARILRAVADKLNAGRDGGYCLDINGNTVGEYGMAD